MVTNINLASPESEKKVVFSGKVSLILSLVLLFLAVGIYAAVSFISNRYKSENAQIENQIQTENAKISGPEYAEMADFQEKLNLIEKVLEDHVYFENYIKNFSKYVLPEVRLSKFDWKNEGSEVAVSGIAPNFDTLSKELILLKNSPLIQSVEFKSAAESSNSEGQSGINFELSANIKKEALNK
jgi:Tfp pilus assembly protein PilN